MNLKDKINLQSNMLKQGILYKYYMSGVLPFSSLNEVQIHENELATNITLNIAFQHLLDNDRYLENLIYEREGYSVSDPYFSVMGDISDIDDLGLLDRISIANQESSLVLGINADKTDAAFFGMASKFEPVYSPYTGEHNEYVNNIADFDFWRDHISNRIINAGNNLIYILNDGSIYRFDEITNIGITIKDDITLPDLTGKKIYTIVKNRFKEYGVKISASTSDQLKKLYGCDYILATNGGLFALFSSDNKTRKTYGFGDCEQIVFKNTRGINNYVLAGFYDIDDSTCFIAVVKESNKYTIYYISTEEFTPVYGDKIIRHISSTYLDGIPNDVNDVFADIFSIIGCNDSTIVLGDTQFLRFTAFKNGFPPTDKYFSEEVNTRLSTLSYTNVNADFDYPQANTNTRKLSPFAPDVGTILLQGKNMGNNELFWTTNSGRVLASRLRYNNKQDADNPVFDTAEYDIGFRNGSSVVYAPCPSIDSILLASLKVLLYKPDATHYPDLLCGVVGAISYNFITKSSGVYDYVRVKSDDDMKLYLSEVWDMCSDLAMDVVVDLFLNNVYGITSDYSIDTTYSKYKTDIYNNGFSISLAKAVEYTAGIPADLKLTIRRNSTALPDGSLDNPSYKIAAGWNSHQDIYNLRNAATIQANNLSKTNPETINMLATYYDTTLDIEGISAHKQTVINNIVQKVAPVIAKYGLSDIFTASQIINNSELVTQTAAPDVPQIDRDKFENEFKKYYRDRLNNELRDMTVNIRTVDATTGKINLTLEPSISSNSTVKFKIFEQLIEFSGLVKAASECYNTTMSQITTGKVNKNSGHLEPLMPTEPVRVMEKTNAYYDVTPEDFHGIKLKKQIDKFRTNWNEEEGFRYYCNLILTHPYCTQYWKTSAIVTNSEGGSENGYQSGFFQPNGGTSGAPNDPTLVRMWSWTSGFVSMWFNSFEANNQTSFTTYISGKEITFNIRTVKDADGNSKIPRMACRGVKGIWDLPCMLDTISSRRQLASTVEDTYSEANNVKYEDGGTINCPPLSYIYRKVGGATSSDWWSAIPEFLTKAKVGTGTTYFRYKDGDSYEDFVEKDSTEENGTFDFNGSDFDFLIAWFERPKPWTGIKRVEPGYIGEYNDWSGTSKNKYNNYKYDGTTSHNHTVFRYFIASLYNGLNETTYVNGVKCYNLFTVSDNKGLSQQQLSDGFYNYVIDKVESYISLCFKEHYEWMVRRCIGYVLDLPDKLHDPSPNAYSDNTEPVSGSKLYLRNPDDMGVPSAIQEYLGLNDFNCYDSRLQQRRMDNSTYPGVGSNRWRSTPVITEDILQEQYVKKFDITNQINSAGQITSNRFTNIMLAMGYVPPDLNANPKILNDYSVGVPLSYDSSSSTSPLHIKPATSSRIKDLVQPKITVNIDIGIKWTREQGQGESMPTVTLQTFRLRNSECYVKCPIHLSNSGQTYDLDIANFELVIPSSSWILDCYTSEFIGYDTDDAKYQTFVNTHFLPEGGDNRRALNSIIISKMANTEISSSDFVFNDNSVDYLIDTLIASPPTTIIDNVKVRNGSIRGVSKQDFYDYAISSAHRSEAIAVTDVRFEFVTGSISSNQVDVSGLITCCDDTVRSRFSNIYRTLEESLRARNPSSISDYVQSHIDLVQSDVTSIARPVQIDVSETKTATATYTMERTDVEPIAKLNKKEELRNHIRQEATNVVSKAIHTQAEISDDNMAMDSDTLQWFSKNASVGEPTIQQLISKKALALINEYLAKGAYCKFSYVKEQFPSVFYHIKTADISKFIGFTDDQKIVKIDETNFHSVIRTNSYDHKRENVLMKLLLEGDAIEITALPAKADHFTPATISVENIVFWLKNPGHGLKTSTDSNPFLYPYIEFDENKIMFTFYDKDGVEKKITNLVMTSESHKLLLTIDGSNDIYQFSVDTNNLKDNLIQILKENRCEARYHTLYSGASGVSIKRMILLDRDNPDLVYTGSDSDPDKFSPDLFYSKKQWDGKYRLIVMFEGIGSTDENIQYFTFTAAFESEPAATLSLSNVFTDNNLQQAYYQFMGDKVTDIYSDDSQTIVFSEGSLTRFIEGVSQPMSSKPSALLPRLLQTSDSIYTHYYLDEFNVLTCISVPESMENLYPLATIRLSDYIPALLTDPNLEIHDIDMTSWLNNSSVSYIVVYTNKGIYLIDTGLIATKQKYEDDNAIKDFFISKAGNLLDKHIAKKHKANSILSRFQRTRKRISDYSIYDLIPTNLNHEFGEITDKYGITSDDTKGSEHTPSTSVSVYRDIVSKGTVIGTAENNPGVVFAAVASPLGEYDSTWSKTQIASPIKNTSFYDYFYRAETTAAGTVTLKNILNLNHLPFIYKLNSDSTWDMYVNIQSTMTPYINRIEGSNYNIKGGRARVDMGTPGDRKNINNVTIPADDAAATTVRLYIDMAYFHIGSIRNVTISSSSLPMMVYRDMNINDGLYDGVALQSVWNKKVESVDSGSGTYYGMIEFKVWGSDEQSIHLTGEISGAENNNDEE